MRIARIDAFSGIAGDMWVAALLDLGVPIEELRERLAKLGLEGVSIACERVLRGALAATHFTVTTPGTPLALGIPLPPRRHDEPAPHAHRGLAEIRAILRRADLPAKVRERAEAVFVALAEAEAKVHGCPIDRIHFHEVGAEDAIVDVVAVVFGTELLGIERYHASEIVVGTGIVQCAHGALPIPAPATLELLTGIPIRSGELRGERTTPTGAALLKVLVHDFARPVAFVPEVVGYGAGTRDDPTTPNVVRITLGRTHEPGSALMIEELACTLDTVTGEQLAFLIEGCLERGALDAYATPVTMKKGRPGQVLTVHCTDAARAELERFLLEESGSLGLRRQRFERCVLERWNETRTTPLGAVVVKCVRLPSGAVVARPEDAEVVRLVRERGLSRREVLARLALD